MPQIQQPLTTSREELSIQALRNLILLGNGRGAKRNTAASIYQAQRLQDMADWLNEHGLGEPAE